MSLSPSGQAPQQPQGPRLITAVSAQDYTIAIDSNNRDLAQFPEPNDFFLNVPVVGVRNKVLQISLGSLELPMSQWTVEDGWKRLHMDEGYPIDQNPYDTYPDIRSTFTITSPLGPINLELPARLNPILCVQQTGPTTYLFRTYYDHGLGVLAFWPGPDPIRIIASSIADPALTVLTADNVTILSETTFTMDFTSSAPFAPVGLECGFALPPFIVAGYVYCPPVPSPLALSQVLNGLLEISDHPEASNFYIAFTEQGLFALVDVVPGDIQDHQVVVNNRGDSLPSMMGFSATAPPTSPPQDIVSGGLTVPPGASALIGGSNLKWAGHVDLTPGNYNGDSIKSEVEFQLNRFNFDGCCGLDPAKRSRLTFSNDCGDCFVVVIPYGKYVPPNLAAYIQDQMNILNPSTVPGVQRYTVTYAQQASLREWAFLFMSNDNSVFGLEFAGNCGDTTPDMPTRLGFRHCPHRGETAYKSLDLMYYPRVGFPGTEIPPDGPFRGPRFFSRNYCVAHDATRRKFTVSSYKPRSIPIQLTTLGQFSSYAFAVPVPAAEVQVGPFPATVPPLQTHSMQAGDVVEITDPSDSTFKFFTVVAQVGSLAGDIGDAGKFIIELGGLIFPLQLDYNYCATLTGANVFNLYLNRPFGDCALRPELLGFLPGMYVYDDFSSTRPAVLAYPDIPVQPPNDMLPRALIGPPGIPLAPCLPVTALIGPPYISNTLYNLDGPNYLLMMVDEPQGGSTTSQHDWKGSVLASVFAKIIVFPQIRVERVYAMQVKYSSPINFLGLRVRILNPDHELYTFHGRNWSGTLVLSIP